MDIMMPVMDGYEAIRAIRAIDRLASLPVIAVTAKIESGERERCIDAGANDYVPKPIDVDVFVDAIVPWLPTNRLAADGGETGAVEGAKILVVDDDVRNVFAMTALLERGRADVTAVESGAEALEVLERSPDFDVVLMDLMMPVMDGYDTTRAIRAIDRFVSLPIIAITSKTTDDERQRCLDAGASGYISKPADTIEFLAIVEPWLPSNPAPATEEPVVERTRPTRDRLRSSGREDSPIDGVKILVVDDDIRNIFAMTALLERGRADVTVVESGSEALSMLERMPDFDIVLMDIMMPIMDGYETTRAIRSIERFKGLVVIAVTGKATAGERQRCLDAGANDYVPKPVDAAELIASLRPWLPAGSGIRSAVAPNGAAETEGAAEANDAEPIGRKRWHRSPARGLEGSGIDGLKILRRRRRLPQYLRDDRAPRTEPRRCRGRRERCRRARRAGADFRHRPRPDGHHDAGHGRVRHHARDPGDRPVRVAPHRRCHRQGGIPANASVVSMPEPTPTSRSRWTTPSSSPRSNRGCPPPRRGPLHDRHDASPAPRGRRDAHRDGRARPHPGRRRQRSQAARLEGRVAPARLLHRRGRFGLAAAALHHGPRLRGHPARRPHADHGRFRDRRPASGSVGSPR